MSLRIVPCTLAFANEYTKQHHRNHGPVTGHKFSAACCSNADIVGVGIAGRPVARGFDNGYTLEILRIATDSTEKNVCSMLYRALANAGKALGYKRIITYTLNSESAISVRAAGFVFSHVTDGGNWNSVNRPRKDSIHQEPKNCWQILYTRWDPADRM